MITLKNVTKKYGSYTALDDVNIELPNTGFVALTGENGCGKTTLLNLISTIDKPNSGSIQYNHTEYSRRYNRFLREQVLSFVQQDSMFAEWMSVRENLKLTGVEDDVVCEHLSKLGISDKADNFPSNLSGGQRQKCGFIRGIVRNTPILLVDEPTSSMDAEAERTSFEILKTLSKNRLVLTVSHNRPLIDEYADIILMMENGKIVRTVDNSRGSGVVIEPDRILIPEAQGYDISTDWKKIRAELGRKHRIPFELYAANTRSTKSSQNEITNAIAPQTRSVNFGITARIAMKSIRSQPFNIALGCVFSAVFILLCALILHIQAKSPQEFAYDMFDMNGYEVIMYDIRTDQGYLNQSITMDSDTYIDYCIRFGVAGKAYMFSDNTWLDIGLPTANGYAHSEITNIVLLDCERTSPSILKCGRLPYFGEALITDYIADQYITAKQASSYESILGNGITVCGYPLPISGIIKTDYQSYSKVDLSDSQENVQLTLLKDYLTEKVFACLYINQDDYLNIKSRGIPFVNFNYGDCCADIVFLYDDSEYADGTYYNTVAAQRLNDHKLKSAFYDTYKISSQVIDDGEEKPIVYVSRTLFDQKQRENFESVCYETVCFSLTTLEAFSELYNMNLKHLTPISDTINNAVFAINVIKDSIVVFLGVCVLLSILFSVWMWMEAFKKQRYMLYAMIMYGYKPIHLLLYTGIRLCVKLILEAGLVIGGYCWASFAINSLISQASGYNVVLFTGDIKSALLAFGIYAIGILLAVSVHLWIQTVRTPIKLYRKCGKN